MAALALEKSITFKNVLVATDLSVASQSAVQNAAAIASGNFGKLFLLNAIPPVRRSNLLPRQLDTEFTVASQNLESLVSVQSLESLDHENIVERGAVSEVVRAIIRRKNIDLLVLGTHARTGFGKLVLGSTAERIFREASCPVLTVAPGASSVRPIRRVLYATDFGPASLRALPYAIDFANREDGELILLHLVPPVPIEYVGPYWFPGTEVIEQEEADKRASVEKLHALLPSNSGLHCSVEHVAEVHLAQDGIINFARAHDVDLIVMGIRESGISSAAAAAHLPWAVAYEVVCAAECPVLTIRG